MTTIRMALGLSLVLPPLAAGSPAAREDDWQVPPEARSLRNPVPASPLTLQNGAQLFQKHCAVCHGESGRGDGPAAKDLKTPPADLTDREEITRMPEGEIFWKVAYGRDPMPPFRRLMRDEEIWRLTHYVREIGRTGGAPGMSEATRHLRYFPAAAADCP